MLLVTPILLLLVLAFLEQVAPQSHWTSTALAPWSTTKASSLYGTSVAVRGNTMLVAAPKEDVGTNTNAGAIHVFKAKDPQWAMNNRIVASDGETGDEFGCSIAISPSGLYLLVGAKHHFVHDAGASYVFYRASVHEHFVELSKLAIVGGVVGDFFGAEVALSDDHAVVSAPGRSSSAGTAYVFERSGVGAGSSWSLMAGGTLVSGTSVANNQFGASVAILGHVIVVGVPGGDLTVPTRVNAGWADVFVLDVKTKLWSRSTLSLSQDASAESYDYTGSDVAVGPGTVLVSSPLDDHSSLTDVGTVHSYTFNYSLSQMYESGKTNNVIFTFEQDMTLMDTSIFEVQNMTCDANAGTFRLSLGALRTDPISHDDDLATLTAKLQALNSVEQVVVGFDLYGTSNGQASVCRHPNPKGINIKYVATSYGSGQDVPTLLYVPINLDILNPNVIGLEAQVSIETLVHGAQPTDELVQMYDYAKYGESISISPGGRFASVGAIHNVIGGKVNVYHRNETAPAGKKWFRLGGINASSPLDTGGVPINVWQAGHRFGGSISLDDERLIVGAPNVDANGMIDRGAAYMYAMVPNPPNIMKGSEGNGMLSSLAWSVPSSNAANIVEYEYVVTPVLGDAFVKNRAENASVIKVLTTSSSDGNSMSGLVNGQAYNVTVRARSTIGYSLFSSEYGPLIPAEVPNPPEYSSNLKNQMTAQDRNVVNDQSIDVFVTLPIWNGGSGMKELSVVLSTKEMSGQQREQTMTQWINSTGVNQWWFNFTGLVNGMKYIPKCRVNNWVGWSDWYTRNAEIIPASIPTSPVMGSAVRGSTNATLYFAPPELKTGATLTYVVTVGMGRQNNIDSKKLNWTSDSSPMILTGLENGKTYTFMVRAYNWMGWGPNSIASNEIVPATVPDPINDLEDLMADPGDMNITVYFQPPLWNGGTKINSYTLTCLDVAQNVEQKPVTINVADLPTRDLINDATGNTSTWFMHVFVNMDVPLINGNKYTVTVAAINDVGKGASSSTLCWPHFKGLRDWEIALLIIAPLLIILFVVLYVWKCKHRNPITCKPLKTIKRAAVAPEPPLGGGGRNVNNNNSFPNLELGGVVPKPKQPASFLNMGLDDNSGGGGLFGGSGGGGGGVQPAPSNNLFDALRTGQTVHVAQKKNRQRKGDERRQRNRKNGKRRQL